MLNDVWQIIVSLYHLLPPVTVKITQPPFLSSLGDPPSQCRRHLSIAPKGDGQPDDGWSAYKVWPSPSSTIANNDRESSVISSMFHYRTESSRRKCGYVRSRLLRIKSRENRFSTFYQFFDNDVVELDLRHHGLRPPTPHRAMHQIRGEHGGQVGGVHLPREM